MSENKDGLELLRAIKDITYNFQIQKKLSQALHESKRRYYTLSQGQHVTTQVYLEQYQNVLDVLTHSGGNVGLEPGLMQEYADEHKKTVKEPVSTANATLQTTTTTMNHHPHTPTCQESAKEDALIFVTYLI